MQVLAFSLTSSEFKGYLFHNNLPSSQFHIPFDEMTLPWPHKICWDSKNTIFCSIAPLAATLHKDKVFQNVPSTPLKKLLRFYENSLFPFEEGQAKYVSSFKKKKKTLSLSTTACIGTHLEEYQKNCQDLGLDLDFVTSWQRALYAAFQYVHKNTTKAHLFYVFEHKLHILFFDKDHIEFSSVLDLTLYSETALFQALSSLQSSYKIVDKDIYIACDELKYKAHLTAHWPALIDDPLLQAQASHLLYLGAALEAQKNSHNLITQNHKSTGIYKKLLQKMTTVNAYLSGFFLVMTGCLYLLFNSGVKAQLDFSGHNHTPLVITESLLEEKMQAVNSLKNLENIVYQAPSVWEIMTFLSSHPILSETDSATGKNTAVHEFSYLALDHKSCQVTLRCVFPKDKTKEAFESDLKKRRLSFSTTKHSHVTEYKITFPKTFSL